MSSEAVCDILRSEGAVEAIGEEWRQLYDRASRSLFANYDWFHIWWNVLAKKYTSNSLHVVTGRRDGKLVAVLPLYITRRRGLRLMQAGGHKAFYCCDMLAEQDSDAIAVWNAARRSPYYDFADIRDVYPESACHTALSTFAHMRDVTGAYSINVEWKKGDEFLKHLSQKTRRDYTRYVRRLEDKGPLSYHMCREEPVPTDIVDDMVRFKIGWGKEKSKTGLFNHPDVAEYFRQLTTVSAQQKSLALSWLKCGDETFAYFLWFNYKGTLRGSVVAYDPAWISCSPGNIIMAKSIMWGIDHGFTNIDIAQGGAYKAKFSNHVRECAEFTFAGSLRGKLIESGFIAARKIWRRVKGIDHETEGDAQAVAKMKKKSDHGGDGA